MKKLRNHMIGIDQGEILLFSDYEHNGAMWTGQGQRQVRATIRFSEPFLEAPAVQVGFTMWDMSNAANGRADITTEEVTETGFGILFRTWGDTKVARVRVGWQAIGQVRDEDQWDIA